MRQATRMLIAALASGSGSVVANPAAPDLDWLAGHWCSEQGDRRIDEVWLAGSGSAWHGVSRTLADGRLESFEFMRIEADAAGTRFLAQPQGAAATAFALVEQGPRRASFANPAHDFPRRIDYQREGDRLQARISGPGRDGEIAIPFDYRRCD
jgi:hypothetical protein